MGIYTVNNAQEVAQRVKNLIGSNEVLVNLVGGNIGIATYNEKGYRPTHLILPTQNYKEIGAIVNQANAILFPHRSGKENAVIMLSSMRK